MQTKLFEIRDRMTCIVAVGTLMATDDPRGSQMLHRKGYGPGGNLILLADVSGGRRAEYDSYAWGDRTWLTAHNYIEVNWERLPSGAMIDVQEILGEQPRGESEFMLPPNEVSP
jgi:hypothetical protein